MRFELSLPDYDLLPRVIEDIIASGLCVFTVSIIDKSQEPYGQDRIKKIIKKRYFLGLHKFILFELLSSRTKQDIDGIWGEKLPFNDEHVIIIARNSRRVTQIAEEVVSTNMDYNKLANDSLETITLLYHEHDGILYSLIGDNDISQNIINIWKNYGVLDATKQITD